jgi:predicted nuclease of predicted toxin-antitoxin system
MKLLIDMNLSPEWVPVLEGEGWESVHWSRIGDLGAFDREIMEWARTNGYTLVTHDLDFGAILAATKAERPSVVQIRAQDINPYHARNLIVSALKQFKSHLDRGALVSVDETKSRARILPLSE